MATLTEDYAQLTSQARKGNIDRAKAIESIFDKVIQMYGGGELLLDENQKRKLGILQTRQAEGKKLTKGQQRNLDEFQSIVGEGPTFGKSYLDILERTKVRDVSAAKQSDISRGLYGLRDRGAEWESSTGAGARLKLEDLLTERLSSALGAKASFLQSIEEPYPDYSGLMEANRAQAAVPSTRTIGSSGTSPSSRAGWSIGYGTEPLERIAKAPSGPGVTYGTGPTPGGSGEPLYDPGEGTNLLKDKDWQQAQSGADLSKAYADYLRHEMQQGHLGYMSFEEFKAQYNK